MVPCTYRENNGMSRCRADVAVVSKYLQVAYKLRRNRAPDRLAAIKRVLLGNRPVKSTGGLTRI